MTEGFAESRARSFTNAWPVAPEYRIVDGHVCPLVDGQFVRQGTSQSFKGCESYLPMAHPEIPGELAKAATGDEADVLMFVRRYGLLGYGQDVLATRLSQLVNAPVPKGDGAPLRGDPLPWVLAHARTVHLALNLLARLDDDAALHVFLETLKVRTGDLETLQYRATRRGYLYLVQHTRPLRSENPPRDVALDILANVLNENLIGVSRMLIVEAQEDGKQGFTSLFESRNLLDCVYWLLADAATGGWVRRCADPQCGAFFVAKSERVKYCPPPMGHQGVSPCMNRHKQRKHRQKPPRARRSRKGKR